MKKSGTLLFAILCMGLVRGQGDTNTQNLSLTVNGVSFEMVFVKGGTFVMGCTDEQGNECLEREKPAHKVTISDFYIGKYPITQAQWKAVMESEPDRLYNTNCDDCPVEKVSWGNAQEFIKKLKEQTFQIYRLPTEAEWEFACRGGVQSAHYTYSGSNNIDEVAWYNGNYELDKQGSRGSTHPVGAKKPNELGIYDMSGNVWDWCSDLYDKSYYNYASSKNPKGPGHGSHHVVRGGCWRSAARCCRVAERAGYSPDYLYDFIGFRLVLVL